MQSLRPDSLRPLAMASQAKQYQGKHSTSIPQTSHLDQFSYNYQNQQLLSNTTIQENESQKSMYKVFYMSGPIMNHAINGGPTALQGSMNPNANLFIPRVVYTQNPPQVLMSN